MAKTQLQNRRIRIFQPGALKIQPETLKSQIAIVNVTHNLQNQTKYLKFKGSKIRTGIQNTDEKQH